MQGYSLSLWISMPIRVVPSSRAIAALLLLTCVSTSPLSLAQDAPRSRSTLEEVVVTAQRREESIRDVPIAMQAFTGESLRQLGVVDTRDLANIIPGFSFGNSGWDTPIFTMRGVGFNDRSRTANSSVGVYVDEVPIAYPYMTQGANLDLERTEVLKGPQGTLYGRNTTGGAINYIANKPADSLEFGIDAEYGRFERYSLEGYVSGPLTERLGGRIALRSIKSDEGWQISLTRPEDRLGKEDKQAARGTLEWVPIDPLRLNFSVDWWRDRSDPQAPQAIALDIQNNSCREQSKQQGTSGEECLHPDVANHPLVEEEDPRPADWPEDTDWRLDNDFLMPALRAYWDATDRLTFALIAGYSEFETGSANLPLAGLSVYNIEQIGRSTSVDAHSVELRANGDLLDQRLQWLAGLYRGEASVDEFNRNRLDTQSATFNIVPGVIPLADKNQTIGKQDTQSNAVFASVDYAVTPSFELTLGARYTDEIRRFAGCSQEAPDTAGTGFSPIFNFRSLAEGGSGGAERGECLTLHEETRNPSLIRKKLKEDNLGGKVSINWTPWDGQLFYLSYSRGFKSGSFPIVSASDGSQYDPVTQERVDAIELGGKTEWFDGAIRVDFAVFDYDYKDKQVFSFFIDEVFGPLNKLVNAPETKIQGAELQIQASPLSGLFVSAAASYLDTEIEEFVGVSGDGETVDFSGNELPFAPKRELTLLANYSFPLPLLTTMEGKVGVDYSYVGRATSRLEDDSRFDLPSYELVNARIGIGDIDGRWDVTAWARNATDEFYLQSVPSVPGDTLTRYPGMPRTYGLSFSYRYY